MASTSRIEREKTLRREVLRGQDAAWRVLYDSAFQHLYRYVHFRAGKQEARTEEVLQECWMVAVRRIKQFDPEQGSFSAWMQGIAQNVLRNAQRSWRRDQEGRREANLMELAAFENTEALALSEQISLAFTELPDHYQAVLRARYTDQRSVAQIATASQVSFKAMESLLQRAREAFRRAFAKYQGEELPEGSDHGF